MKQDKNLDTLVVKKLVGKDHKPAYWLSSTFLQRPVLVSYELMDSVVKDIPVVLAE